MNWPNLVQDHCRCQVLRYVGRYLWARLKFFSLSTSLPVASKQGKKSATRNGNRKFSKRWARNGKKHRALHLYPMTCKKPKEFLSSQKFKKEEKVKTTILLGLELCLAIQRALRAGGCLLMHARTLHLSSLHPSKAVIWSDLIWSALGKYCYSWLCWKQISCNPCNTAILPRNYTFEVDKDNRIPIFIHVSFLHSNFTYFSSRNSKNQIENTEVGHSEQPQLIFSVFLYWNVWNSFIS